MLSIDRLSPLLDAVPSFAPVLTAWRADERDYVARFPEETLTEREEAIELLSRLARHVGRQVAGGERPEEVLRLFDALERLYRGADGDLWDQLTIGFLESVIFAAEHAGGDAAALAALVAGPETEHAWCFAWRYTHVPEPPEGSG